MPRNVRNFWLELDIGGKKQRVATGPRNKEDGFYLTILMRENGSISQKKMHVRGYVNSLGKLRLAAWKETEKEDGTTEGFESISWEGIKR